MQLIVCTWPHKALINTQAQSQNFTEPWLRNFGIDPLKGREGKHRRCDEGRAKHQPGKCIWSRTQVRRQLLHLTDIMGVQWEQTARTETAQYQANKQRLTGHHYFNGENILYKLKPPKGKQAWGFHNTIRSLFSLCMPSNILPHWQALKTGMYM